METTAIDKNITVFYVEAGSFPSGIEQAHARLHALAAPKNGRRFFGLSRPEQGMIRYKAAAEELFAGEGEQLGCKTLVIKKGNYLTETLRDYAQQVQSISPIFDRLVAQPVLDPQGYCVEWYVNDEELKCMVRLAD